MSEIAEVLSGARRWCVVTGTAFEVLRTMPDACVDAMVTDPPAGIAFMNAAWDRDMGGRNAWIATIAATMREALRVCKPGAHALVWSLPRTSHWTATALEDAGWEIRDRVSHLFASGFPKSHNVSKAIDRRNGDARKVVGSRIGRPGVAKDGSNMGAGFSRDLEGRSDRPNPAIDLTAPGSPESAAWEGWGTALKPAVEDWWLVRKPLEGTIAENVLAHGTGALNIDACRIGSDTERGDHYKGKPPGGGHGLVAYGGVMDEPWTVPVGRWPAHLALSHSPDCVRVGTRAVPTGTARRSESGGKTFGGEVDKPPMADVSYADADGLETIDEFECTADCPVRMLDEQSGERSTHGGQITGDHSAMGYNGASGSAREVHADSGGASRFFFVAKPSQAERAFGLEEEEAERVNDGRDAPIDNPYQRGEAKRRNTHPTVKSLQLMRWLVRLVTPPGGVVVDPFCGSGSTIVAARREGMRVIGIDQSATYADFARARVARWEQVRPELDEGVATTIAKQEAADPRQMRLVR